MEASRKKLRNSDFDCVFCHQYIEDHSSRYLTNNQSVKVRCGDNSTSKRSTDKGHVFEQREKLFVQDMSKASAEERYNLKRNLLSTESELIFRRTISSSISAEKFTSTSTKTVTSIPPRCNLSPILLPINKETKIPKRLEVTV